MVHYFSAIALLVVATVVYGERSTHLVTMTKSELMDIINCVSFAEDPMLCQRFAECEKKMADQVIVALNKCEEQTLKRQRGSCRHGHPLFSSPQIPSQIFECIVANTFKLSAQEKKRMVEFEECTRRLSSSCKSGGKYYH